MYLNKSDYLEFDGIDLDIELPNDDNAKGKVDRFLNEVERFTIMQLRKYGFNESMVNDSNLQDFKYGLMYQVRRFLNKGRDGKLDPLAWDYFHQKGFIRAIRY
jgi:hypothetical protein